LKFGKSTEILDNILIFQRSPFIKICLGYDEKKISPREMQKLRSQIHQKRKMNQNLKTMPIFSKAPSTMKAPTGKEMMTNISFILPARMSSEELLHQEDPSQTSTKIYFFAIVFVAITLFINKEILKMMQEVIVCKI
jgi:hypothetical protein